MEIGLVNKKLTRTDIASCLAYPTGNLWAFQMLRGQNAVNFNARDPTGRVWEFKLCTRNHGRHKKPVIRGDWLDYVREKGLTVDDFIILTMVEDAENGVRYVMRCIFGDPKQAPHPLEKLSPEETVSLLWKGDGSLADELLQCMSPYMDADILNDLRSRIHARDPSDSDDIQKALQKSLLWLRDEVRSLPCTYKCRHDAAADLIHVYAYTKNFFRVREYDAFTSPPVHISPLDLGPKCADKLGGLPHKYQKTYGGNYCMGQLIFWHIQTNTEPDFTVAKASKGCLSLPEIGSFHAKVQKPSQQRIYGPNTVKMMLERMEKYPQKPWPKDRIWSFKNFPKVFGCPMLDGVLNNAPLDGEMVHWLKHRPTVYQSMWDR
ncbi:hypothetical protein SADUNF_Sadunf07G0101800 [Salix dunnii]|uniref:ATXR3 C-terminal domain-containing protein n=1 Tax=Salix dunnii TaxID=1413687 RepID=A0A835MVN9_9ROSI|nr:hypothetical protein SADUNF_Sadunf07G0101800 [Salix dunnii]